jgi:hypothetical protein
MTEPRGAPTTYSEAVKSFDSASRNCFIRAILGRENLRGKLNLKIVLGSLGLGKDKKIVYEFGGLNFTRKEQFMTTQAGIYDIHVWLEDDNGNIYDVVTDYMLDVARFRRLDVDFNTPNTVIEGITKRTLAERGLHYLASESSIQEYILNDYCKQYKVYI